MRSKTADASARQMRSSPRPDYYGTDKNYSLIVRYLEEHVLPFKRDALAKAFRALSKAGRLEVRPGTTRQLTVEEETQLVADLASGENLNTIVLNYVNWRSGKHPRQYRSLSDFMASNSRLCSEAAWWLFFHLVPEADHDNPSWKDFAKKFLGCVQSRLFR
jgi:hypothetical protein